MFGAIVILIAMIVGDKNLVAIYYGALASSCCSSDLASHEVKPKTPIALASFTGRELIKSCVFFSSLIFFLMLQPFLLV